MKIIIFAFLVHIATSRIIPERFPQPCSKSNPSFNQCSLDYLNHMVPLLMKGVPELSIPKFTTLKVPVWIVNGTVNENMGGVMIMKNIKLAGHEALKFTLTEFDFETLKGEIRATIPSMYMSFDCDITGKFFDSELKLKDHLIGIATNLDFVVKYKLNIITKLGAKYFTMDEAVATGTVGDIQIKFAGKNPETKSLLNLVETFFNSNSKELLKQGQHIYDESMTLVFKTAFGMLLQTIPAQELVPDFI